MTELHTHGHDIDTSSVDDGRMITPVMMMLGAVLAVLAMAAIVYLPAAWGISPYGSDTYANAEAAPTQSAH